MADTVVATYGADGFNTPAFTFCKSIAGSGSGTDPPADHDIIRVWLNRCPGGQDVAHVTVDGISNAGPSTDQYVWSASPGGTHITHFGDHDGGSGDLTFPNEFYDPGYYDIQIGSRADMDYCFTVTWDYCDPDLPTWGPSEQWHVGAAKSGSGWA